MSHLEEKETEPEAESRQEEVCLLQPALLHEALCRLKHWQRVGPICPFISSRNIPPIGYVKLLRMAGWVLEQPEQTVRYIL